jgi:hypothetical protein
LEGESEMIALADDSEDHDSCGFCGRCTGRGVLAAALALVPALGTSRLESSAGAIEGISRSS